MPAVKGQKYKVKPKDIHRKVLDNLSENGGNKYKALIDAGYSEVTANSPDKVIETKGFQQLLEERLSDDKLTSVHESLLTARKIEHMIYPTYDPAKAKEREQKMKDDCSDDTEVVKGEQMTDKEIRDLHSELGEEVKKIVHGESARHVYYWSFDNATRDKALDKAYKLKGSYAPEKRANVNMNIDVTNQEAQDVADKYEEELKAKFSD